MRKDEVFSSTRKDLVSNQMLPKFLKFREHCWGKIARTHLKNCPGSPVPSERQTGPRPAICLQIGPNPRERDKRPEGGTTGGRRLESSDPAGDSSEGGADGESWGEAEPRRFAGTRGCNSERARQVNGINDLRETATGRCSRVVVAEKSPQHVPLRCVRTVLVQIFILFRTLTNQRAMMTSTQIY
jgi:hypothetical protein